MNARVRTGILIFLCFIATRLPAQTKKELEQRKAKIQKEIDFTNKQLQIVSKNKNATAGQLNALRKKISLRQQLINTINAEVNKLGGEIQLTSKEITSLQSKMDVLKADYAKMIRYAWINRNSYQQMTFIFASADFNQAYKRAVYLQQYAKARREQAAKISTTQGLLSSKKSELESKRSEKTKLRSSEQKEKQVLETETKEQDKVLKNLTVREQKLRKDLAEKKAAKQKLDKAIESVIRKEITAARKKAVASGTKNVTNENVFNLTPEAARLSGSFAGNKGSLPWPVEQGNIVSTFGEHPHKELKNITIKNNGVDISSAKGAGARAIFEGKVSGVISIPGSGNAVIIRHGEYLTVYSNLEEVLVRTGDKVTTRQKIGTVGADSDGQRGEIHLEIWKNTTKMNPQLWLAKR